MHFCADELVAILAAVPFVGAGVAWARSKWKGLRARWTGR